MAPFAKSILAESHDLLDDGEDRVADALGLRLQLGEVDVVNAALGDDFVGALGRDDAHAALHARQRRFDLQVVASASLVAEDAAHLWGAEDVAEDG